MGRAPTDGDLSSVCRDGIPPYRIGSKKQLQREMHRSVKANGQVSLPHFPVSSGGSCRVCVDHGKCWDWGWAHVEGREQGRGAFPSLHDAREEMLLLDVGQEPRALCILAKTCLCTVTFWSFPDNEVLIRAFQWHWSCPLGPRPGRDTPVGSSESLVSGHHPDTSAGAEQTGAWPRAHRWWPSKAHRL